MKSCRRVCILSVQRILGCFLWKFEIEELHSRYDITSYESCVPSWKAILQFSMGCLCQYTELPTLATLLQVTFLSCAGMLNVNTGSSPLHSLKLKLNACSRPHNKACRITSLCIIMLQSCAFQHGSTYMEFCGNYGSDDFKHNSFKYSHKLIVHWTWKCVGNCAYAIKTLFTHCARFPVSFRCVVRQPINLKTSVQRAVSSLPETQIAHYVVV